MASSSSSSSSEPRTSGKKSYTVELYFDEELESNVLALVKIFKDLEEDLEEMMEDTQYRPSITLFTTQSLDPQEFEELLRNFASNHQCLRISFSEINKSRDKKLVPTLLAEPTLSLRSLHVELYTVMYSKNVDIPKQYLPGFWAPHCTIGAEMAGMDFWYGAGIVMFENHLPLNGNATSLGLVEQSDEGTKIYLFPLKNVSGPENA